MLESCLNQKLSRNNILHSMLCALFTLYKYDNLSRISNYQGIQILIGE